MNNTLETRCTSCCGTGVRYSERWSYWWSKHNLDWREALAANVDVPDEPEEKPCRDCEAAGTIPTEEGKNLLFFLKRHGAQFLSKCMED
jgi:hypothetical protein